MMFFRTEENEKMKKQKWREKDVDRAKSVCELMLEWDECWRKLQNNAVGPIFVVVGSNNII